MGGAAPQDSARTTPTIRRYSQPGGPNNTTEAWSLIVPLPRQGR